MINGILEMLVKRSRTAPGPSIPTDYVFYAPLKTDINDHSTSARTGTLNGSDSSGVIIGDVKDGVTCTYVPSNTRILYSLGDIPTGGASRTMSIWVWTPDTSSAWNSMMGYGAGTRNNMFALCYNAKKWAFGGYFLDIETDVPVTSAWHNLVATYDGTEILLYLDGTEIGSLETSAVDTSSGYDLGVAGRGYRNEGICEAAWFAAARIYSRVLTGDEITALANEDLTGGDTSDSSSSGGSDSSSSSTGGIPTDYAFYASLSSKSATSESGSTLSYSGGISEATQDGVPCLDFSRASGTDRITTNFKVNPDSNVKTFTACWWMWLRNNSYDSGMLGRDGQGFRITVLQSGKVETTVNNITQGRIVSSSAPSTGAWHFIVYTGNGSTTTLYVDGVSQGTASYTNFNENYDMIIGNGWGQNSFNGCLAAVRFYRRVLTGDEITALYNEDLTGGIPTDYVFYAPLQNDINDHSASDRTGSYYGDSTNVIVGDVKDNVKCTYLPVQCMVTWPVGDAATGHTSRTMSCWIYSPMSSSLWNSIMSYGTKAYYSMWVMGYYNKSSASGAYGNDIMTSNVLSANAWHNTIYMYDASTDTMKLYLDGVLVGTKTTSQVSTVGADISVGGRYYSLSTGDDGKCESAWFAAARLYNRVLTGEEIAALANEF